MKIWIDDIRYPPAGYVWCKSVNQAKKVISAGNIELIDIDHDAGAYFKDGGDYIRLLDWLELTNRSYPIHIHSMNPVGVLNMRKIIQKNSWIEI